MVGLWGHLSNPSAMCNNLWLIKNETLKGTGISKYIPLPHHTWMRQWSSKMVCDQRLENHLETGLGFYLLGRGQGWRREEEKSKWDWRSRRLENQGMNQMEGEESRREQEGEQWGTRGVNFEDRTGCSLWVRRPAVGQHGMLPYTIVGDIVRGCFYDI
jgi:hypothetical protein